MTLRTTIEIIDKPAKDLYREVQHNAKFNSVEQMLKTRIGINNFYHFRLGFKSSILMRDVIMNSPYVSAFAFSSQVLNKIDSPYSIHKPYDDKYDSGWNIIYDKLIKYENEGYTADEMRSLFPMYLLTNYTITVDLLTLVYLTKVLDNIIKYNDATLLYEEAALYYNEITSMLKSVYDIDVTKLSSTFYENTKKQFQSILACSAEDISKKITGEDCYEAEIDQSSAGGMLRHRTLYKCYKYNDNPTKQLTEIKQLTAAKNYDDIGKSPVIEKDIKNITSKASSLYEICQGSIIPLVFSGMALAIESALSQRVCVITDTPGYASAIKSFIKNKPDVMLFPPCKCFVGTPESEVNECLFGYVNEARLKTYKGIEELEKTQLSCPIWCERYAPEILKEMVEAPKFQWYFENIPSWTAFKKRVETKYNK